MTRNSISALDRLLDFLLETYNIQKRIFYPQLILHIELSSHPILWFCSIGTPEVLHPNFPISLRRLSTYFLWEIKIPYLEYATSIPRKYFNFPNFFISNFVANFSFKVSFSISSS
ncbi:hypothetical protein CR513_06409, partial [Mucuna pruriens]